MSEEEKPDLAKKAIQVIFVGGGAAGLAAASGASPEVTLAATLAASSGQAGDLLSSVWGSLRQRWNRNGQATLEAGAAAAELDLEEFLQRFFAAATATPGRESARSVHRLHVKSVL